jgi:hypothetical protein
MHQLAHADVDLGQFDDIHIPSYTQNRFIYPAAGT